MFLLSAFRHAKRTVPEGRLAGASAPVTDDFQIGPVPEGRDELYKCQLQREVSEAAPLGTLENANRDDSPNRSAFVSAALQRYLVSPKKVCATKKSP